MKELAFPSKWLIDPPKIQVVGAGGTGSAMLAGLAQLCIAIDALGGKPPKVVVWDADTVSAANVGRQAFTKGDIGRNKASVLVNRINNCFGLSWHDEPRFLDNRHVSHGSTIWIGCVDTRKARSTIRSQFLDNWSECWWLDCGNSQRTGQVVLGVAQNKEVVVPSVAELFPETVNVKADAKDNAPSCSLPEALAKQDLFINRAVADAALQLLWQLFRYGNTTMHGAFVNLESMRTVPIPISIEGWQRMGWEHPNLVKLKQTRAL